MTLVLLFIACFSQAQEKVNFSDSFIKANKGKYKIEINEVKELIQIMVALTPTGKENDDMVQQQGDYYKNLRSYFKPYENERIIKVFDSLLQASPFAYVFLTGNGISYNFKGNKLEKNQIYIFPATSIAKVTIKENPIEKYKNEIEAFAKRSGFRKFYSSNKKYYAKVISDYEKNANLGKQWKWLESRFETKIGNYVIFCSPLVNGYNYTGEFNNNNFRQIFMNLPPLEYDPKRTAIENELFNTRVMFSEIDHNYVGPPSLSNKLLIDSVMKNRNEWVDDKISGTSAYPAPINVFNEYMTYGVFVLYSKANYDNAGFNVAYEDVVVLMKARGFFRMKEFVDALLKVQAENAATKLDHLYPTFLKELK